MSDSSICTIFIKSGNAGRSKNLNTNYSRKEKSSIKELLSKIRRKKNEVTRNKFGGSYEYRRSIGFPEKSPRPRIESRPMSIDNIKNIDDAINEIYFVKKKQEDYENQQQILIHRVYNLIDENKRLCIDLMKTKEEFERNIYFL